MSHCVFQDSITAIPHDQWNPDYLSAAPQCVRAGPSCISSTFTNPSDGLVIQAENNTDDNGHGSVRPPYLLDHTVRLAYISRGQVRSYFKYEYGYTWLSRGKKNVFQIWACARNYHVEKRCFKNENGK